MTDLTDDELATATLSIPEWDGEEDFTEFLGRKADFYTGSPPPAPPGFWLVECTATPRHWPRYEVADEDFFEGPCEACVAAMYRDERDIELRRTHRRRHWLRARTVRKAAAFLYELGVITSYGTSYGGPESCDGCLTGIRVWGSRPYVLFWPGWKWTCLLRGRHWPGEYIGFGCGKCAPCPDCGTTLGDHICPKVEGAQ